MAATTRRFALRRRHAGLLLTLVGAVSVIAGVVETTVSSAVSQNCPIGATLLAKFQYSGARYVFDGPDVNRNVMTVEDGTAAGANWHSTIAVSYVVVAGGPGAITTSLSPMLYASRFSNVGLPSTDATTPDIAGVQFCRPDLSSTTTTSATDTDAGASSTTVSPSAPTSTITNESSTTTTTTTTTAAANPPTSVSSVTRPASTTTTEPGATTGVIEVIPTDTTIRPPHATSPAATAAQMPPAPTTSTTAAKNTVPAPTTTVAGATTTTTINPNMTGSTIPTTISPGSTIPTTISPGGATSTSVYAVLTSLPSARLPRTGSSSSPLIAIGIVLLGAGLGVTVVDSRRERGRA